MQQLLMMESVLIFSLAACRHFRQVPGKTLILTRFSHSARNLYETQSSTLVLAKAKIRIMLFCYFFTLEMLLDILKGLKILKNSFNDINSFRYNKGERLILIVLK